MTCCRSSGLDQSSDAIGQAHPVWEGPTEVNITDEALGYAWAQRNPTTPTTETVTLSVKVTFQVRSSISVNTFIEDCDYKFTSNTTGVIVQTTESVNAD